MKQVDIKSIIIPNRPRSGNYPTGSTVIPGGGGSSSTVINQGGGVDLTQARKEFLSKKSNDTAQGIIDFLKGVKISGDIINKILKAGSQDEASDEAMMTALKISEEIRKLEEKYIRKDIPDSTKFLLKFLAGAFFGEFLTGIQGGMIDKNGDAELRSIYVRKRIISPEYAYNRVTYIKGKYVISPGGGCTVDTVTDNGDGTYTIKPDLTEADALSQFPDDILTTYFVTRNSEGVLNGFEEMKFRVVSSDFDSKTFVITPKPGNNWVPQESMILAQTGNFTDAERQTYIIFDTVNGNNSITFFDHANTWDPEPSQMPIWIGKKKGMTVAGINCDDYPAVLQNILMTGLIFQIDEITGDTVRVPIDKGEWKAGQYGYYNRVSHNGALWLCISEEGTSEEPGTGNAWLKQVAEGKPGLSVVGGGHWEASKTPYAANTMVTLFNCVFISNVETSEPPLAIARFKNGNYRRKPDGGYILAGKSADFTVHPDWTMLLDGRELKGTSITFLGSYATAPSNPVEGNSYYNTTDKCTYIYQNGVWMLMVSDGKDGRDYEYIYRREAIIGLPPETPDSKQQDDYVPEGWTDDFLGCTEIFQVEWGCKRTKRDGVWSEWSDPAPVHRWAKDGENAIYADLDNEMVSCALTFDGKATEAQSWVTNVSIWYGTEEQDIQTLTTTQPTGFTVSADKNTGRITVSVAKGASVPDRTDIEITLVAQISGQNYERKLTFTIAGIRAGATGADAVLYSLVPSVTSVTKDKNGSYSVASVSCKRQKSVGSSITDTTEGELKYSLDGGAEVVLENGVGISPANFNRFIKFIFYVSGKIVDIETVPLILDGRDGEDGRPGVDGISINPRGHWEDGKTPFFKNDLVNFAYGTFVALRETSEPPLAIARFKNGNYRRKLDGGYILAGNSANMTVHSDWQMMTPPDQNASYWLDSPISSIGISSVGNPSPSSVQVTCRMSIHGSTQLCGLFYLVARKYNGSWLSHVSPVKGYTITVPATGGYTQFAVRAYRTSADANAWNDNYVCEKGIGVSVDGMKGEDGADSAFLYDNGPWKSGTTYVWNDTRRDKVIHPFDGVYYNFLVKAKGMSVTAAPSSITGDANWEAANKFVNIATDSLFADGANIANFMFKNGVMRSQDETDGVANMILNGKTGYFHCSNVDITGTVNATGGSFKNVTFSTAESGDRVIIDASTNSIKMMSGNNLVGNFFFYGYGGYKSAQLYVNNNAGEYSEFRPGDIVTTTKRTSSSEMIECQMNAALRVQNLSNSRSITISDNSIQIYDGQTYTGFTGIFTAMTSQYTNGKVYVKNGIIYKVEQK